MNRIHFTVDGRPKPLIRHRDMYDKKGMPLLKIGKGGGVYNPKRDPSRKDKNNFLIESLNHRPKHPIIGPICLVIIFWMKIAKANKRAAEAARGAISCDG